MKKIITFVLLAFLCITSVDAAYLDSNKTVYTQPNGNKVIIYTTGDEYFRYSHDKNKNVIVLNDNGYYTYAVLKDGKAVPSSNIYDGKTIPSNTIKVADIERTSLSHSFETPAKNVISSKLKKSQTNGSGSNVLKFNNTVIFIRFAGETEFVTEDYMKNITELFGTSNSDYSSLKSYVNKVTEGTVEANSTLLQYNGFNYYSYQSSYKRGYVEPYSSSNTIGYTTTSQSEQRLHEILLAALKSLNTTEQSNVDGDNDGYIDNIIFIVNGESSGNWADILWPHQWYLSPYYTTSTFSGAKPFTYNLQFAEELEVGVLCHETMHSLGMPDLYRYNYQGDPAGPWDMMNYNLEGTYITSYIRSKYGYTLTDNESWANKPLTITESGVYELDLISTNSNRTSYMIATDDSTQFIQLEYRGTDSNTIFDKYTPEKGLIISRINTNYDSNVGTQTSTSYTTEDVYYIFRPNETSTYGLYGGAGDLDDAAITPTLTVGSSYFGSKSSSATLYNGAITLANGTNTQIYIKNVMQVDDDTLKFEIYPKGDNMFLNYSSYSGTTADTFNLVAHSSNSSATVTYVSSNTDVATVSSSGLVTLVGAGTANITVTCDGTTKVCAVTSTKSNIKSISTSIVDAHNIKVRVNVDGTPNSVNIYAFVDENEANKELIASNLVPDASGNVTFTHYIGYNGFGKIYTYKASVIEDGIEKISNISCTIDTTTYLPNTVSNVKAQMTDINKIKLSYDKLPDADGYHIYVSDNILGPYNLVSSIKDITYDYTGSFGQTYYFKVAAYKLTESTEYEGVHSKIVGMNTNNYLLDAPTNLDITALSNTSVKLVFGSVTGATNYNIYRSTNNKNFTKVATVDTTEYTDTTVSVGTTYYYKVSAVKDRLYDGYKSNVIYIKLTGMAPTGLKITNYTYTSLRISYDKMDGIDGYEIYYSTTKNGKYKRCGITTGNAFIHKNLKYNGAYYYKVRSYKTVNGKKVYSNFSLIVGKRLRTPAATLAFTPLSTSSVKLTWNKASGANSYRIYYRTASNGTYKLLKSTTSNTYTATKLTFGTTYYFKIISYRGSLAGDSTIKEYTVIPATPKITFKNNVITTSKVSGANGYDVFVSQNDGSFGYVGTMVGNTFTVENDNNLNVYYVKAYRLLGGEKVYSNASNCVSNVALITTTDFAIESTGAKNIRITVDGNEYVDGYYLYVSTSKNGTYKKVANAKGNVINYSGVIPNKAYYFKVRPYVTVNGSTTFGSYSTPKYYKHSIKSVEFTLSNVSYNSVKISWNKIAGASGYQIAYKEGIDGKYKYITTTSNSYIHKKLVYGSEYYYKVRSYTVVNKKKIYSSYSAEQYIATILPSPTFTLTNSNCGTLTLTLKAVSGANSYSIYMSTDGENFTKTTTTKLTNIFSGNDLNATYYFKVAAIKNNVEGVSSTVKTIKPYVAPVSNFTISNSTTKATDANISWSAISGVTGYELYLEGQLIYKGADASYVDHDLIVGKKYTYSVRGYVSTGDATYYSNYAYNEITPKLLKVNNLTITSSMSTKSLLFKFDAVKGAIGYKILRSTSKSGKYTEIARCNTNECTVYNITIGAPYYYKVVAYTTYNNVEVNGIESNVKGFKFLPEKVTNTASTSYNLTSIKVTWDKMPNVSGYEVWYSTAKTGTYKKVKTTTGKYAVVTKLTTGRNYYFKVRSYVLVNGKKVYSSFSDITYTYARPATVTNLKVARYNYSATRNKVYWTKVSGVTGYAVYKSTDGVNYTYIGSTTKNYLLDNKASSTATNYYKVRTYKKVGSKNIYSNYSAAVSMSVAEKPTFSYWISSETDSSLVAVFFKIHNTGSKPLTLLSADSCLIDRDYASFDRTARLISYYDLAYNNKVSYVSKYVINANENTWAGYALSSSTWYDQYSKLYFYFIYDGVKYCCSMSSYYGCYTWPVT